MVDRGRKARWWSATVAGASVAALGAGLMLPQTAPAQTASPSASAAASSSSAQNSARASNVPTGVPSVPTISVPQGDSIRARQYWLTEYGFTSLWKDATGKGVTVAVIDTGVDASHQDLKNNILAGADVSGTGNSKGHKGLGVEPEHGTLVASMIAGHGHSATGVRPNAGEPGKPAGVIGIAPEAKIYPISLELGTVSAQTKSIDEQIPAAVRKAVDAGVDIINLSVGSDSTSWPGSWDSAFTYAEEKDVLIVVSAGNRGAGITQVGAPATIPGVLTVGGIDSSGKVSLDSSTEGISIAVTAPSENLVGAYPGNKYAVWDGTSAAAPMVSGLAALIKEKYPELTSSQIIQRIIESAQDAGEPGRDNLYGFGIIDPKQAMAADTPDDTQNNPLGSMEEWVAVHRKQSQTATPTATPSIEPVHQAGEEIEEVAAPAARRPAEESGILPFIVLGGFGVWIFIITAGSIYRLKKYVEGRQR